MVFSSMLFIWIFLPAVIVGNYVIKLASAILVPKDKRQATTLQLQNIYLLIASLIFYAWGGFYYLFLMLAVIALNFVSGILIGHFKNQKKSVLIASLVLNIGLLGYFKYFNLLISTIEALSNKAPGALGFKEVILPIGISFFIFQAMSYTIDVYRLKVNVQKNPFTFALYVALFPQLIAGPIVQYKDIEDQLSNRHETPEGFTDGIRRFCYGLGKKVLIANILGGAVDSIWAGDINSIGASIAWLGMVAYTLQIYYDFSGYSDMAIGIGKMLGFEFRENFNYPYTSLSIREFWRRWHISLSSWFRDYVYIPLGGSRNGQVATCFNLFIVFLLTGIWHGANYTFFVWGLYYAFFIIIERVFLGDLLEKNPLKIINFVYSIMIVMVGWVFFRADTLNDAMLFLSKLFVFTDTKSSVFEYLSMKLLLALVAGIVFSGPLGRFVNSRLNNSEVSQSLKILDFCIQMMLLLCSIVLLVSGTYNPFIYFQF